MADLTTIIERARDITGNKVDRSLNEVGIPDEAIEAELLPYIRDLNKIYGTSSGVKEIRFTTTANQQNYSILADVGTDVQQITEVLQSDAHYPDYVLGMDSSFLTLGGDRAFNPDIQSVVPAGLQGDVFRTIVDQQRAERASRYSWDTVGDTLRLYPPPGPPQTVSVKYVSTGSSIGTLPTETENALTYAAVVAICDGVLNRISADRAVSKAWGEADLMRIKTVQSQRDRYEKKYLAEFQSLSRAS
jgi:hypothetical protein